MVFAQSRSEVIRYPTLTAWNGTAAYSVGDIVGYNNTSGVPGQGSGIGPTATNPGDPTYYNTATARAYICLAAVPEPVEGSNLAPDDTDSVTIWKVLEIN